MTLTETIAALARERGADLVGFADVRGLAELPRAVVVVMRHSPEWLDDPSNMPNLAYLKEIGEVTDRLSELGRCLEEFLREKRYGVRADPPTGYMIDNEKLAAPFPHKTAATRAGLGWIGKCALLVTPELGPALRLTSVLTDAPVAVGRPITESRCGECTLCADICPAGAVSGEHWWAGRPREQFYDAHACRDVCFATRAVFRERYTGCGACMAVCPVRPRSSVRRP